MSNIIKVKGSNGEWISIPALTGADGITPHIGENGHWFIGETDTGVAAGGLTEIPVASADTVGGIKVGANLQISEDGTLSANDATPCNVPAFIGTQENPIDFSNLFEGIESDRYHTGFCILGGYFKATDWDGNDLGVKHWSEIFPGSLGVIVKNIDTILVTYVYRQQPSAYRGQIEFSFIADGTLYTLYAFPSRGFIAEEYDSQNLATSSTLTKYYKKTETYSNTETDTKIAEAIASIEIPEVIDSYTLPGVGETQIIQTLYGNYTLTTNNYTSYQQIKGSSVHQLPGANAIVNTSTIKWATNLNNTSFKLVVDGVYYTITFGENEVDFSDKNEARIAQVFQDKIDQTVGFTAVNVTVVSSGSHPVTGGYGIRINPNTQNILPLQVFSSETNDMLTLLNIPSGSYVGIDLQQTIQTFLDNSATEMTYTINDASYTMSTTLTLEECFTEMHSQDNNFTIEYNMRENAVFARYTGDTLTINDNLGFFDALGFNSGIQASHEERYAVTLQNPKGIIMEVMLTDNTFTFDGNLALAQILQQNNTIDLTAYATKTFVQKNIPTKLSVLNNDVGFITNNVEDLINYDSKTDVDNKISTAISNIILPTKVSDLTNDTGFITSTVDNLSNYYKKSEVYTQTEVNGLINAITTLNIQVVSTLPTTNISTTTIYLKGTETTGTNDYEEWIYVNNNWELIGTTAIDLTPYITKEEVDTKIAEALANKVPDGTQLREYQRFVYKATPDNIVEELLNATTIEWLDVTQGVASDLLGILSTLCSAEAVLQYSGNTIEEMLETFKTNNLYCTATKNCIPYTASDGSIYTDVVDIGFYLTDKIVGYYSENLGFVRVDIDISGAYFMLNVCTSIGSLQYRIQARDGRALIQRIEYTPTKLDDLNILSKTNTREYTPTTDYHPATKKYVDEAVASIEMPDSIQLTSIPEANASNEGKIYQYIGDTTTEYTNGSWYQNKIQSTPVLSAGTASDITIKSINSAQCANKLKYIIPTSGSATITATYHSYDSSNMGLKFNFRSSYGDIDEYLLNMGIQATGANIPLTLQCPYTANQDLVIEDFFDGIEAGGGGDTGIRIAETDTGYWISLAWTHNAQGRKYIKIALNNPSNVEIDIIWYWHSVNGITYDMPTVTLPYDFGTFSIVANTTQYRRLAKYMTIPNIPTFTLNVNYLDSYSWSLISDPITKEYVDNKTIVDTELDINSEHAIQNKVISTRLQTTPTRKVLEKWIPDADNSAWTTTAPYYVDIIVEGVTANDTAHITPIYYQSLDSSLRVQENWNKIDRAQTIQGAIRFYCFEEKPSELFPVQIEIFSAELTE